MVNIKRPVKRGGGKGSNMLNLVRAACLVIVIGLFVNNVYRMSSSTDATKNANNDNDGGGTAAQGLQERLRQGKQHISQKNSNNNNNNSQQSVADLAQKMTPKFHKPHEKMPPPPNDAMQDSDIKDDNQDPKLPIEMGYSGDDNHDVHPVDAVVANILNGNAKNNKKQQQDDESIQIPNNIFADVVHKSNTGPAKIGYVKNFLYEREHPTFRGKPTNTNTNNNDDNDTSAAAAAADSTTNKVETTVATIMGESSVKSCTFISSDKSHIQLHSQCLEDSDSVLIAYNGAEYSKFFCGQTIEPHQAIKVIESNSCATKEAVHLFSTDFPPIDGHDMDPIVIKSHDEPIQNVNELSAVTCDVPCMEEKGMTHSKRYIDGQPDWVITKTMNDSWRSSEAKVDPLDYRKDHYYSTQSFKSSIPLTHYDFEKYSLRNRPPTSWDDAYNKGVYMVNSDCASQGSRRNKYFQATAAKISIDAMGSCHHNKDVPNGQSIVSLDGRLEIMKQYRMVLAFDYMTEKDHISPHIWEAFMSGAVPVIVGADNIKRHVPPNSMIFSGDFQSWDLMADHVREVVNDKAKWTLYHAWRTNETALQQFEAKYEFSKTSPTCRMCKWAYAKQYGLGWDHERQVIMEPLISRQLCLSSTQHLVLKPFMESWIARYDDNEEEAIQVDTNEGDDNNDCKTITSETLLEADSYKVDRTILEHDGVIDIHIDTVTRHNNNKEGDLIVSFQFPMIQNTGGAYFPNSHVLVQSTSASSAASSSVMTSATIQDEHVKITIIANWKTTIVATTQMGEMELVVLNHLQNDLTKEQNYRVRVIVEDFIPLTDKMTEYYPSSFAKKLIQDFIDPVALFYVDS